MPERNDLDRLLGIRKQMAIFGRHNEPLTLAKALKVTHKRLVGLSPMEPVNLQGLVTDLTQLNFNAGDSPCNIIDAIDVLTDSVMVDKKRTELILSEWDLLRLNIK